MEGHRLELRVDRCRCVTRDSKILRQSVRDLTRACRSGLRFAMSLWFFEEATPNKLVGPLLVYKA